MSHFIKFDDALINTKHIICLFPSEEDEGIEYKGKWYKIYNLFKIAEPTTGGDRTAVRFYLGCSKYLSQELYFGGYNAYLFAPDFTYGGETDTEKAIVNYV